MKTIILLPVYNEEATLEAELGRLKDLADFILIINDGSADKSGEILGRFCRDNPSCALISHSTNQGKSKALSNGFSRILEKTNEGLFSYDDIIIITDADGQLPSDVIPEAMEYFLRKKLDMLIGARDFNQYPFVKKLGNLILSTAASILSGFSFRDTQCGFRILTVEALERILPFYTARGYACEQQLSQIAVLSGLNVDNSFPVKPVYYRSNSTFRDAFYIAADSLITFFRMKSGKNSHLPVRKVLKHGLSNSALSADDK
ncbi:MAG: glycosyltransferase family 2 protein [Firmicutes bacterium]|nr:glycosyltransferase family 2 protein [Bacillota bacterium]